MRWASSISYITPGANYDKLDIGAQLGVGSKLKQIGFGGYRLECRSTDQDKLDVKANYIRWAKFISYIILGTN